ncbi:glycosyltransferase family 4 protein [Cyclobacterium sp.]|uniref:glycosyltransferase family 4 protein n=1 Tax=Cyclobacterium sp. TaxID=1966343 RepID=UPI0019928692|nr:glycosyltransferase family 4 protein [Cyclobacterium sp.]MBD3627496.1 glycosyltransferase family 4 protein [Cyclobacterium sp.]
MKKIIFLIDTISVGGAELSVLEVAKNLKTFEVLVCVVYDAQQGLKTQFEEAGIRLVFFQIKKRFGFRKAVLKFKQLLKEEDPALVHATNFKSEIISRLGLFKFNIPLVGSIISDTYGIDRYKLVSPRERLKLNLYKLLNRATAGRVDKFISVSEAIVFPNMKYLKQPRDKFIVIPNGRNTSLFARDKSSNRNTVFPQIPSPSMIIISTSRVIKSKGFDEMIEAFQKLLLIEENVFFVVAGDGFDLEYYKQESTKAGIGHRVLFLGRRDDIPRLLQNSDIFWFPSHYEGSPGVVIEAMLAKIPIIASDIVPILENLKDGYNALICKKGDSDSLLEKTEYLLAHYHEAEEMAGKAHALALEKFDIRKLIIEQENFYLSLISQYDSEKGA